jgi:hypothetical protein
MRTNGTAGNRGARSAPYDQVRSPNAIRENLYPRLPQLAAAAFGRMSLEIISPNGLT